MISAGSGSYLSLSWWDILNCMWDFLNGQFISTLVGVFLGAGCALLLEQCFQNRAARRSQLEAQADLKLRRDQALNAVRDAVTHADGKVNQLVAELSNPNFIAFYHVDPEAVAMLLPRLLETSVDMDLIRKISDYKYELEHLSRKVNLQYEMAFRPDAGRWAAGLKRDVIVNSIISHSNSSLIPKAEELKKLIAMALGIPS